MADYPGLPGVHRPLDVLEQDAGNAVLIRVPDTSPWESHPALEWTPLEGPNRGVARRGAASSPATYMMLSNAAIDRASFVVGRVLGTGAVAPLDSDALRELVVVAGELTAAHGWAAVTSPSS